MTQKCDNKSSCWAVTHNERLFFSINLYWAFVSFGIRKDTLNWAKIYHFSRFKSLIESFKCLIAWSKPISISAWFWLLIIASFDSSFRSSKGYVLENWVNISKRHKKGMTEPKHWGQTLTHIWDNRLSMEWNFIYFSFNHIIVKHFVSQSMKSEERWQQWNTTGTGQTSMASLAEC